MTSTRSYSELIQLATFESRFEYLALHGKVGHDTFGFDRWINQRFYRSREWKDMRERVIFRDNGCDLGVFGYEIFTDLFVHHMNPVKIGDITDGAEWVLDPEYLITTSLRTHNAIHYGDLNSLPRGPVERKPGDTRLW